MRKRKQRSSTTVHTEVTGIITPSPCGATVSYKSSSTRLFFRVSFLLVGRIWLKWRGSCLQIHWSTMVLLLFWSYQLFNWVEQVALAGWRRTKEQHSNLEIPIFRQDNIIPQCCNDNRFHQTKHNDGRGKPSCTISRIRHGVFPQRCNDNGFHQTKHKDGSGKPLCTISQIRHGVLLSIITVSSLKWRT